MARNRAANSEVKPENVDPHAGHGGSYVNSGGVNHDVETEPARQLLERTEHRVVRSAEADQQEAAAKAKSGE